MSKEFALEEILWDCTTVDGHKRAARTGAESVDLLRHEFLAVPVSPRTSAEMSVGAIRRIILKTPFMGALVPMMSPCAVRRSCSFRFLFVVLS